MAESRPTADAPRLVCRGREAMGTRFEVWLAGEDEEHLTAVAEAALDEIARIEQRLSRFAPTSEISRINRRGPHEPVRVDHELFSILEDCRRQWEASAGYFDICASALRSPAAPPCSFGDSVQLDASRRTVRLSGEHVALDLGGYGKGYALENAARVVRQYGVRAALLHGGTSSVLAFGRRAAELSWRIGIRDPFAPVESAEEVAQLELHDCGFSSSATFDPRAEVSDIIDPHQRAPLRERAACYVLAPSAAQAEVLSTAFLAMGREKMEACCPPGVQVGWLAPQQELEWFPARQTPAHASIK